MRAEPNGCLTLEESDGSRRWVVWPPGATTGKDGAAVIGGVVIGDGAGIAGTGTRVDAADLPQWSNPDSLLGATGRFCDAAKIGAVALDEVHLAER